MSLYRYVLPEGRNAKSAAMSANCWNGSGEHMNALPHTMSGGQQQRIAIARAIITRPRLLLADEPTGNLDEHIGMKLMNLFEQLNRMGTTIVIATHDEQMMQRFHHSVMQLDNGTLHMQPSRDKANGDTTK